MKTLTVAERHELAGPYFAPEGLYEYTKSLPFVGNVWSDVTTLVAGEWTEIVINFEVGASGLADGAWIKGTFKFYSDWALFQTSDRAADNYVSAEYVANALRPGQEPATVQGLAVRFDQKGHERPFQKAVIIDVVDGYLNPGDRIVIRLGDRRWGGRGTRVQTFVETGFRWRFYIDPVGTSRFAPIQPDLVWDIVPGAPHRLVATSPRLISPGVPFSVHVHPEDTWGNVNKNLTGVSIRLAIADDNNPDQPIISQELQVAEQGWANAIFTDLILPKEGRYTIHAALHPRSPTTHSAEVSQMGSSVIPLTVATLPLEAPRPFFADLHVHSDDTVGTHDSLYNFSYGRDIAALDILGYTANDFNVTAPRWDATLALIRDLNKPGSFVLFPGTEWCGNSAAGGDHNVVFLGDLAQRDPEFPFDRHGNVARSFEWNEHGPSELVPGAWPLDELYATYAHDTDGHLLIPHVGGRRCNLAWHHPGLERLVEVGSAWGQFEWLIRDSVRRGWKMGVSANSDEHRGRCGGGVSGTAVFGTKGGLTGVLASKLERGDVATALRARRTFATTGERLVGLVSTPDGLHVQGDEWESAPEQPLQLSYHFLGNKGFSSIEAWDASGLVWKRSLWTEAKVDKKAPLLRVSWGGARLYDRYREAVWNGTVELAGGDASVQSLEKFGGFDDNPEDSIRQLSPTLLGFSSRTSGDTDGVHVHFKDGKLPLTIAITGTLHGYVKVGNPLAGNPHKAQPTFELSATWDEVTKPGGKSIDIAGGAELFVRAEVIPDVTLPTEVRGTASFDAIQGGEKAIYFVGREWSGHKVVTSPVFVRF
ncbi:hypothetical protein N0V93_000965 [Gnomoniopsis smithogilvyi]|uniref:DUF3604 domain-containing protein n=1 Tax=Gnomoniopsis smithogilvyi TaxID=1191159 RepID=A0A9W8Z301_9PEZI|nr:hypothetical protein N0V93_000965 [Gnomoniopsis smithogilvyi]